MKYDIVHLIVDGIHKALVIDLDKSENRLSYIGIGQNRDLAILDALGYIKALEVLT